MSLIQLLLYFLLEKIIRTNDVSFLELSVSVDSVEKLSDLQASRNSNCRLIALTLHHCSRAVYREHRLPVALQLALSLNSVPDVERNFLLGEIPLNDDEHPDYKVPDWVPEERRLSVRALASSLPQVSC